MANDDDTQRERTEPDRPAPLDAFYRALSDALAGCDGLGVAIRARDRGSAEIAAQAGASSWLVASAAIQRLHHNTHGRDSAVLARFALRAAHRALVELFKHAAMQIDAPTLHQRLCQLRLSLALADGQGDVMDVCVMEPGGEPGRDGGRAV